MRISDWSSDVCSSDLPWADRHLSFADRADPSFGNDDQGSRARLDGVLGKRRVRTRAEGLSAQLRRGRAGWRHQYGLRSEEHTSELQSLMRISYTVFCLKKKII